MAGGTPLTRPSPGGSRLSPLGSRHLIVIIAIVGALVAAVLSVMAGLDALGLVLGGAIVATALLISIGAWLEPARRAGRRHERRTQHIARKQGSRTRHAVHAAERRLFSQLEALAWLRDELELQRPLPPTRGAATAPDALLELVRIIDRTEPAHILELGCGVSTIVMAARLKSAGKGSVVALEHEARYAEATRAELRAQGLEDVATVVDAPLTDVRIGDADWRWYTLDAGVPERVDVLFVDGPPAGTGPLARYPAVPLLLDRLAPGATVLVDDGDRPDEQEMVRRWESEIEGLAARHRPFAKGAWLVTMPA